VYLLRKLFRPELFQGAYKTRNYFEGWYYKLISKEQNNSYAVIPGIALGQNAGDEHAFVQVINGRTGRVDYFRYPIKSFKYDKQKFNIAIEGNYFSRENLRLMLTKSDLKIAGELHFHNIEPFPRSVINPGIMGPYTFVPFMECYHSIVNINHNIEGSLYINEKKLDFTEGEGYLEKDYGKSFPSEWIWIQANHFDNQRTSFMFSLAHIPWFGSSFIGFICFIMHRGKLYRFASYNGSHINRISLCDKTFSARLTRKNQFLEFRATGSQGGFLRAPKNGLMEREIEESITANVEVNLSEKTAIVFSGKSSNAGYELSLGVNNLLDQI